MAHLKDARDKLSRRNDKRKSDPYLTSGTIKSRLNGGGGRVHDGIFEFSETVDYKPLNHHPKPS